jgi:hypothetical protein
VDRDIFSESESEAGTQYIIMAAPAIIEFARMMMPLGLAGAGRAAGVPRMIIAAAGRPGIMVTV